MPLWKIAYSHPNPVWKQYDAPYFDDYQYFTNFEEFKLQKSEYFLNNSNRLWNFCRLQTSWNCFTLLGMPANKMDGIRN